MHLSTGPVFDAIDRALAPTSFYRAFRDGTLSQAAFIERLVDQAAVFDGAGLLPNDIPFARRLPSNPTAMVDDILADLEQRKLLRTTLYDQSTYARHAQRVGSEFDHGGRRTYIYPEESRLLYALVDILRPRNIVFVGSYYGFWAMSALPALRAHGGRATLIDIDPEVTQLSRANIESMGYADVAHVITGDAREVFPSLRTTFDIAVIDAECPADHPDPKLRGKRIYHPLLESTLPWMNSDALLLWHNILLMHGSSDPFFQRTIAKNLEEYEDFLPLVHQSQDGFVHYATTEGVGIGWRGSPCNTARGR